MKRAFSLLLCIAILLGTTGCKNTEEQTATSTTTTNVSKTQKTTT